MASLGIDGLASGLDTSSIIASLMQLEAAPQVLLKRKQQDTQSAVSALQSINTKLRSLAEAADKAASPAAWKSLTATASSDAATAVASATATNGSLTFSVGAVATAQVSLSDAIDDGAMLLDPPTFTVKHADGTTDSITAASGSPADIAHAINDAGLGVTATVVRIGAGETAQSRIQFTSATTGTAGTFEILASDSSRLDGAIAREAADASITLWQGSPHEQTFTQSSNTFTGLMTGVDVTVAAVTPPGESVTVNVAPDPSAVKGLASGLVGALSVVLSDMDSRTASTVTTTATGGTTVTGGLLSGDASVRALRSQLVEAMSYPVDGVSPSSVGIVLGRDGNVTLDEAAFAAAIEKDPQGTAAFVQALAARVEGVATTASDPYDGTFTQKVTSQQSLARQYEAEVAAWDTRLEMRRATLQRTYSSLEVTLSNLSSQSSWLASQLSSLQVNQ